MLQLHVVACLLLVGYFSKAPVLLADEPRLRPAPPLHVTVELLHNRLNISWLPPRDSPVPIESYGVEYRTVGQWIRLVNQKHPTFYLWKTYSHGALYQFRVFSYDQNGVQSESSVEASIYTGDNIRFQTRPSPPLNVRLVQVERNHLNISWLPPSDSPVPVAYYSIAYQTVGQWVPLVNQVRSPWYIWTTASRNALYHFRVYSHDSNDVKSEASSEVLIRTTDERINRREVNHERLRQVRSNDADDDADDDAYDDDDEEIILSDELLSGCNQQAYRCQLDLIPYYSLSSEEFLQNLRHNGIRDICRITGYALDCVYEALKYDPCLLPGMTVVQDMIFRRIKLHRFVCERNIEVIERHLECLLKNITAYSLMTCFDIQNSEDNPCDSSAQATCTERVLEASRVICPSEVKPLLRKIAARYVTHFTPCIDGVNMMKLLKKMILQ